MNDCVVTRLLGSSQKDNLPILGKIKLGNVDAGTFQIKAPAGFTISSPNGTFDISNTKTIEDNVSNVSTHTFVNDLTGNVYPKITMLTEGADVIIDKYDIDVLVNYDPFDANAKINFSVKLEDLEYVKRSIYLQDNSLVEASNISDFKFLDTLESLNIANTAITGNVATFNPKNLTLLNITDTSITGDFKIMAENAWNNGQGRTSGYMVVNIYSADDYNTATEKARVWDGDRIATLVNNRKCYIIFSPQGVSISANAPA